MLACLMPKYLGGFDQLAWFRLWQSFIGEVIDGNSQRTPRARAQLFWDLQACEWNRWHLCVNDTRIIHGETFRSIEQRFSTKIILVGVLTPSFQRFRPKMPAPEGSSMTVINLARELGDTARKWTGLGGRATKNSSSENISSDVGTSMSEVPTWHLPVVCVN